VNKKKQKNFIRLRRAARHGHGANEQKFFGSFF
jgi:hypothetical protein